MSTPTVAVIGLGCIGGSLARALSARGVRVRGWSTSPDDCAQARAAGVDASATALPNAIEGADIVVLAVPVQAMAEVAPATHRAAAPDATIVHCCGVQSRSALGLDDATFATVFGAHPISGSHDSGFGASRVDLFAGCTVSLESRMPVAICERVKRLWTLAGAARIDVRDATEHDALMAWISHLPQLASTALAATLASSGVDPRSVGPGARDSTRLAASSFDQWSALVRAQHATLDVALARLEGTIASMRAALTSGDQDALRSTWESAREWRRGAERPA